MHRTRVDRKTFPKLLDRTGIDAEVVDEPLRRETTLCPFERGAGIGE
jgi:hypothetical protein